ncbi:MAG: ATP-binding protein, partial [Ornithinimicrobium sp.]
MSAANPSTRPPGVLLLCGPSGAGKSRLAGALHQQYGWPVVELDDFYRDGRDPALPMSPLGLPDWDDPTSWDIHAALTALEKLRGQGEVEVPIYDIGRSCATGSRTIRHAGSPVVVAEGIFASELIGALADRAALVDAWCIRDRPWLTFAKRLARDLRQHRKPAKTLWRRGHQLRRAEPGIVSAQQRSGATPMTGRHARRRAIR